MNQLDRRTFLTTAVTSTGIISIAGCVNQEEDSDGNGDENTDENSFNSGVFQESVAEDADGIVIYWFWSQEQKEESEENKITAQQEYLQTLTDQNEDIKIVSKNIDNQDNINMYSRAEFAYLQAQDESSDLEIPSVLIGETAIQGFTENETPQQIESKIEECRQNGCPHPVTYIKQVENDTLGQNNN
jgi:hypothetical protein